jgi:hypothetical protein
VRAVLQPEAAFILEYANKQNLKAIGRYLLRRQQWSPFARQPVEFAALNFDFHPAAIREWLQAAGFSIERQLTVSHLRLDLLKRHVPTNLLVQLDALFQRTGDWWQLTPSVFVAARAVGGLPPAARPADVLELFRCPACRMGALAQGQGELVCQHCDARWPVVDGIYDFRAA